MVRAADLVGVAPNILLVGDAGSGKTSAVMTLGEELELWDIDGNVRTALACGDGLDDHRQSVEVTSFYEPNLDNKPDVFDRIKKRAAEVVKAATRGQYPYSYLAVDSLTSLCEAALVWAQAANGNVGSQPEQREWGTMARAVTQIVNQLKSIPIPVLFIAHDSLGELNGEAEVRLGLPGKALNKDLPKKFSDLWYFRSRLGAGGKQVFEVHTRPHGAFREARNSSGLGSPLDATQGLREVLGQMGYPPGKEAVTQSRE